VSEGAPLPLQAADGTPLAARLFEPAGSGAADAPVVLIAGALAVPQRFYAPFAAWLATQGWRVLTFDLRGIGGSRAPQHARSLRGLDIDMLGWARQDFAAAVRAAASRSTEGRITLLGHSLGLHHAAMTDGATQALIGHAVAVAAGSGYWRDWAPRTRRAAPLMLHAAAPLLVPLLGWFPGRRLGMVGDLPGPVARQWSGWCRHPGFAWGAEPGLVQPSLQSARFTVHALSISDDEAMTLECTRKLLAAMPHAPAAIERIEPAGLGLARIGHLGAFRREAAPALWPLIERRLRRSTG
jgi:predicted alpha/beta hydrolase